MNHLEQIKSILSEQKLRQNPYTNDAKFTIRFIADMHKIPKTKLKAIYAIGEQFDLEPDFFASAWDLGVNPIDLVRGKTKVKDWIHALELLNESLIDKGVTAEEIADYDEEIGEKARKKIHSTLKKIGKPTTDWYLGLGSSAHPATAVAAGAGDKEALEAIVHEILWLLVSGDMAEIEQDFDFSDPRQKEEYAKELERRMNIYMDKIPSTKESKR